MPARAQGVIAAQQQDKDDDERKTSRKSLPGPDEADDVVRPGLVTMLDVEICTKAETVKDALRATTQDLTPKVEDLPWRLSDTAAFKAMVGIAVGCNSIQLGVEVDYPDLSIYSVLDHLFTFTFFAEFCIKIYDLQLDYFKENWNLLDCVLVWLSVLDCWIFGIVLNSNSMNLRSFSILRILRVARIIRAIRLLRVFRELWKIVRGILDSVKTVFWAFTLLVLLLYVCSIFCCTVISGPNGETAQEVGYFYDKDVLAEMDMEFNVYEYYGTVPRAMYTLFETCIEPLNMRPILEKQPQMLIFFLSYIFLTTFGVLNVIIGVIVESTMASHPDDDRVEAIEVLHQDMDRLKKFRKMCINADTDGNGTISLKELYQAMTTPEFRRVLEDIHMPLGILPEELFSLLNAGGGKEISEADMMRQLTRAVVHTDHQQMLDLKIEFNKLQNYSRASFGHVNAVVRDLAGSVANLQDQQQQIISQNEELKRIVQYSFGQLLSQGISTKLATDTVQMASESKSLQSSTVSPQSPVRTNDSDPRTFFEPMVPVSTASRTFFEPMVSDLQNL